MKKNLIKNLTKSIKSVTRSNKPRLHEPFINFLDLSEIKKCISSNYVSTVGSQVVKFERNLSRVTGAKYVVATNSGTSALHLALKCINLEKNSEVLIPTLNFVASANAIRYCDAFPHFIDSDEKNLSIDHLKLKKYLEKITIIKKGICFNKKTKRPIKALILVHIFGHGGKISEINKICNLFKIKLIEDAAEAIGSYYKKKHLGTFGRVGVLSFNGNKTITTGAGGALLTNEKKLAEKALKLSLISKIPHKWKLEYGFGFNYRMASLNASLGISQLQKLKHMLKNKKKLFLKYKKEFNKYSEFYLLDQPKNCESNFWLNTIILRKTSMNTRNNIIRLLNKNGIQARPCWKLLHRLKHFSNYPKMNLSAAIKLEKKIINIPSSPKYG